MSQRLKVCVVGAGGREHALAVALARSAEVVVTPGNPAMTARAQTSGPHGISISAAEPESVDADLWVVGPEGPLVDGMADRLRGRGKLVFGPGADGARLEGSKSWMKALLVDAGVPSAAYGTFEAEAPAVEFLAGQPGPWVVKADGLAAGKGVLVTGSLDEAIADVRAKLSGAAFGDAGRRVVIEEALVGTELSVMAICDGTRALPLAAAQDHKRLGDGDTGPNTGGMGAFSPVSGIGAEVVADIMDGAVLPTLRTLGARGIDYRGILYAGIMVTAAGPRVLEFNVRFGDPEAQVVLPRWQGDIAAVLAAAAAGHLERVDAPDFGNDAAVCVVLAAGGYPLAPVIGERIEGLGSASALPGVTVYGAGVAVDPRGGGGLVTAGGRVLGVTAVAESVGQARRRAYEAVEHISWPGLVCRGDIAADPSAIQTVGMQGVGMQRVGREGVGP